MLDEKVFEAGRDFIFHNTPQTFSFEFVLPGGGCFTSRRPVIVVALPPEGSEDFTSSLVAFFHEYGHWLDSRNWIESNCHWDKHDGEIARVLRNDQTLDQKKVENYLRKRSMNDEDIASYHNHLMDEGIIVGRRTLVREAVLAHERRAWELAYNGLRIGERNHLGFRAFVEQCDLIGGKEEAIRAFANLREQMLLSYEESLD